LEGPIDLARLLVAREQVRDVGAGDALEVVSREPQMSSAVGSPLLPPNTQRANARL
jgi:hypothetical protein